MRTAAEELEDCEKRLKELEPEQARLERRQRHVEKARLCEQRLAWVKFEEKRELALAAKEAKKTAVEKVKEADEEAQPLREERDRAERARQQAKQKYDAKQRQTADAFAHLERDKKDLEKRLEDLESEKDSSKNAEQRAAKAKAHAEKLRKAADTAQRALEALGTVDVIGLKRRVNALKPALVEAQTASRRAQDAAQDARDALTPLQRDLKAAKQALQKMSTVKLRQQTFERAHGRAGSEAVRLRQWLDQNSGRFRKPVLGPVALETDVEDDGARCALEHAVGSWIWTSFCVASVPASVAATPSSRRLRVATSIETYITQVCQSKTDYDALYDFINNNSGFKTINLQNAETLKGKGKCLYDAAKLSQMRKLGVRDTFDSFVEAPLPSWRSCTGTTRSTTSSLGIAAWSRTFKDSSRC